MPEYIRQCQNCGKNIKRNVQHVCEGFCTVCNKHEIWCQCIDKKDRFNSVSRAYTREGEEVFLMTITTICPIIYAEDARQIALEFIVSLGMTGEAINEIPMEVRPIGSEIATHIACERLAYTDEMRLQVDWIRNSGKTWVADRGFTLQDDHSLLLSTFCTIETADGQSAITELGLEII